MKAKMTIFFACLGIFLSAEESDVPLRLFKGIDSAFGGDSNVTAEMGITIPDDEQNTATIPMDTQVKYVYTKLKGETSYNIVGHSQGGLRALAYAGYLKQQKGDSALNAVVSIGGPVLGFSPLDQGVEVLRDKVVSASTKIYDGWSAALNRGDYTSSDRAFLNSLGIADMVRDVGLEGSEFSKLLNTLDDETTSFPDLFPNSNFIRKYIYQRDSIVYKWVELKTASGTIKICVPTVGPSVWHLPENVKYGFVVGTDSDVIKAAADKYLVDTDFSDYSEYAGKIVKLAYHLQVNDALNYWQGVERCNNDKAFWARLKWWDLGPYRRHKKHAADAREWQRKAKDGMDWVDHYEARISSILGTSVHGNDSFIPVRDQYIDVAQFGGGYIDKEMKGKYQGAYNHMSETFHEDIWGRGKVGLEEECLEVHGVLGRWLYPDKVRAESVKVEGEVIN